MPDRLPSHEALSPLLERLGCTQQSSLEELDAAFIRMSLWSQWSGEREFQRLVEAYAIVADRQARRRFIRAEKRASRQKALRRAGRLAIVPALLAALAAGAGFAAFAKVPSVVGMPSEQAAEQLKQMGYTTTVDYAHNETTPGVVFGSSPAEDSLALRSGSLTLLISVGSTSTAHATAYTVFRDASPSGWSFCFDECHDSSACQACHVVSTLPRPAWHTAEWTSKELHGVASGTDSGSCNICHLGGHEDVNGSFCIGCHGVELPHKVTPGTEQHKSQGRTSGICLKCHEPGQCEACHNVAAAQARADAAEERRRAEDVAAIDRWERILIGKWGVEEHAIQYEGKTEVMNTLPHWLTLTPDHNAEWGDASGTWSVSPQGVLSTRMNALGDSDWELTVVDGDLVMVDHYNSAGWGMVTHTVRIRRSDDR